MSVSWTPAFIIGFLVAIVATMKLSHSNGFRPRSNRSRFYLVALLFAMALLFSFMLFWGFIQVPAHWSSLLTNDAPGGSAILNEKRNSLANKSREYYGIMFDAGSTGSRIHVFKLKKGVQSANDGSDELLDELFVAIKPGLSSYANNPAQGAESLRGMLDKAKVYIPSSQWSKTALGLKATAGLRLLSNQTAQSILGEVLKLFRSYPFNTSARGVSILEGAEEGLYCWFTVNFLQGSLQHLDNTFGILDLGGGSMQITYLPTVPCEDSVVIPPGYLLDVEILGKQLSIYTHSYLGLGIVSLRFQTLGGNVSGETQPRFLKSVCLPKGYSGKWKYSGIFHNISSSPASGPESRFEDCYAAVKSIVVKYKMDKPKDLRGKMVYALSYFCDRAIDVKLIDAEKGGQLTVQSFIDAAKHECRDSSSSNDTFLCLDLCYMSSLFVDGLGFESNSKLMLKKKLHNFEINWSLGALFSYYGEFKFNTRL